MIKSSLSAAGAALAFALCTQGAGAVTTAEEAFMKTAVQTDLAEIQMGKLAQQKSTTQAVKDFGKMLETDHTQNFVQLQSLAKQGNVTLPNGPTAQQQAAYDAAVKVPVAQFDRTFAAEMVKGHQQAIATFEAEAKGAGAVAAFAKHTLPTLKTHLQTAQHLASGSVKP